MATKKEILRGLFPLIFGLIVVIMVVAVIPTALQYVGKAAGVPANLIFNYEGVLGKMPQPWRNLGQGGEEPKEMLAPVVDAVRALRPEYIRLDHIYDAFKVVSKTRGQLAYDWTGLDQAVDIILSTGAKPFLSLSYMPDAISTGDMVSPAKDWNEWGQVVQATIEHYSGRTQKNIDNVIYEVWNEPDLFGGYKTYGDKNYLEMYSASARAAARVRGANPFEIGGPATTGLYQNWLERLIKYADSNNLRMDFVSWHRYSYDLEQYERDAKQAKKWAENIPALVNLKFYVTEWGHDSEVDAGYDGRFGAIHTLAGARAMMGAIDRAVLFEIKDGPGVTKYWGRWGVLTHEKFGAPEKKPRYYAMQFLNNLGPYRLSVAGEGSWVKSIASTDDNGNMKIMVVNYDPKGSHSEAVPITFENLPKGNFKITRTEFMGSSRTLNIATTSATWKTSEFFTPNSAAMFTVEF
ncbi:MAG: transcriptional regulator, AraC family [uncultured bacterium]|nr:MAG: transcriptional regulator, AraC family [uncultured bacterium]